MAITTAPPLGSDFDTIIAAHAMWRDVPLVSLDGGFDGIPGLAVQRIGA